LFLLPVVELRAVAFFFCFFSALCCAFFFCFFRCALFFFATLQRSAGKKAMAATPLPSSCFAALLQSSEEGDGN